MKWVSNMKELNVNSFLKNILHDRKEKKYIKSFAAE